MVSQEVLDDLNRICERCGEYKGRHKATSHNCPIIETPFSGWHRTVGYKDTQIFKEWVEEGETK